MIDNEPQTAQPPDPAPTIEKLVATMTDGVKRRWHELDARAQPGRKLGEFSNGERCETTEAS